MFKKKSNPSLMASASSYLVAVSQADARARVHRPPSTTPALSLSSSITSSSEDTVLDESEDEIIDGLTHPRQPPTSEQVFNTVHTEFGHCANEAYRYLSQHTPGTTLQSHDQQDPPYYILFSTYISYLLLICIGHVRDFVGKTLNRAAYAHLTPNEVRCDFFLTHLRHV
jgi:serine palmitoyltransferase